MECDSCPAHDVSGVADLLGNVAVGVGRHAAIRLAVLWSLTKTEAGSLSDLPLSSPKGSCSEAPVIAWRVPQLHRYVWGKGGQAWALGLSKAKSLLPAMEGWASMRRRGVDVTETAEEDHGAWKTQGAGPAQA